MITEDDCVFALDLVARGGTMIQAQSLGLADMASDASYQRSCEKLYTKSRSWTLARKTQGLGIGEKTSDGKVTDELSIKVYVDKKKPMAKLKNPVPKRLKVPGMGDLLTDVEEIGEVQPESFTTRVRPILPGCGLGHPDIDAGTLGCIVRKKSDPDQLYILSNSHVLAASGQADIGDRIIQPGKYDDGKVTMDTVANLDQFEPFDFDSGYPNLIDAAIAKIAPDIKIVKEIRDLGFAPIGVSKTVRRGMKVQKVGRTTDHTIGIVKDAHHMTRFPYRIGGRNKVVGFQDVVLCSHYTSPGDSGSAVLNMSKRLVGLHFAGSISSSIFCRINNVFQLLELELP